MKSGGTGDGMPDAVVVRLTDQALFQCPFTFMEDAGTARFSDAEVERLRDYLLKSGFLLASDYHGSWARDQFDEQIGIADAHEALTRAGGLWRLVVKV